jgi:monoamine oxidase
VRTWGPSGAAATFRRAQAASRYARRTGCSVDEAAEAIASPLSRRRFLLGAGAAATMAAFPGVLAGTAAAAQRRKEASTGRVVIVGSGIAGLGCAYRLWHGHGIKADVYEYDTVAGGRIRTLQGYFDDGQLVEHHAEFINPEHTATLALARNFGLTLDNTDHYPAHTHPKDETMRFGGQLWPQAQLDQDWHEWGWQLFHDAAFTDAPWPTTHSKHTEEALKIDRMSVPEWINANVPGGVASDFGALCVSAVLDEFGGPPEEQSALNLVYLLGQDDSRSSGFQPHSQPVLGGADEKWHIHGGNSQLISGLIDRLPAGTVHLDQQLVAVRTSGNGHYSCTFQSGTKTSDVVADHVVLALPFTTLKSVDLSGVPIAPLHLAAIREEPLGTNSKMFLQFTNRVWDEEHVTGNTYCQGVVQGGWDATGYQSGATGILAALPGGSIGEKWGSRYGLTSYFGPAPDVMVQDYLQAFNKLFPGVSDAYNGRSFFVWSAGDPHILGAYSYLKVGQYTRFNGIQGQQEGNLHFAGEHTSLNFQGYVEGGLRSGYKCASEVVSSKA